MRLPRVPADNLPFGDTSSPAFETVPSRGVEGVRAFSEDVAAIVDATIDSPSAPSGGKKEQGPTATLACTATLAI